MLRSYSINDCQTMEFNYSALETVVVGKSVNTELPKLAKKLSTERIFLFASNSLSKTTGGFAELGKLWEIAMLVCLIRSVPTHHEVMS